MSFNTTGSSTGGLERPNELIQYVKDVKDKTKKLLPGYECFPIIYSVYDESSIAYKLEKLKLQRMKQETIKRLDRIARKKEEFGKYYDKAVAEQFPKKHYTEETIINPELRKAESERRLGQFESYDFSQDAYYERQLKEKFPRQQYQDECITNPALRAQESQRRLQDFSRRAQECEFDYDSRISQMFPQKHYTDECIVDPKLRAQLSQQRLQSAQQRLAEVQSYPERIIEEQFRAPQREKFQGLDPCLVQGETAKHLDEFARKKEEIDTFYDKEVTHRTQEWRQSIKPLGEIIEDHINSYERVKQEADRKRQERICMFKESQRK